MKIDFKEADGKLLIYCQFTTPCLYSGVVYYVLVWYYPIKNLRRVLGVSLEIHFPQWGMRGICYHDFSMDN